MLLIVDWSILNLPKVSAHVAGLMVEFEKAAGNAIDVADLDGAISDWLANCIRLAAATGTADGINIDVETTREAFAVRGTDLSFDTISRLAGILNAIAPLAFPLMIVKTPQLHEPE